MHWLHQTEIRLHRLRPTIKNTKEYKKGPKEVHKSAFVSFLVDTTKENISKPSQATSKRSLLLVTRNYINCAVLTDWNEIFVIPIITTL